MEHAVAPTPLTCCSQDGNLIFWDGEHGSKTHGEQQAAP